MSFCEVINCNSKNEPGRSYHRFPQDSVKRQEWLNILGLKCLKYVSQSAVCSRHFRAKDYCLSENRKRLLPSAVPVLRLNVAKKTETNACPNKNGKQSPGIKQTVAGPKKHQPKEQVNLPSTPSPKKKQTKDKVSPIKGLKNKSSNVLVNKSKLHGNSTAHIKNIKVHKGDNNKKIPVSTTYNKFKLVGKKAILKISPNHGLQKNHSNFPKIKSLKSSKVKKDGKTNNNKDSLLKAGNNNSSISKKRKLEQDDLLCYKIPKVELADLFPYKSRNAIDYKGESSTCHNDPSSKPTKSVTKQNETNVTGDNISNIEQTIIEMQNKIKRLEQKSVLDEKKIETFKKALIEQRNKDIKILMEEKENELLLRMDLLYLDYDPQRICRLCLLLVDKMESLISLYWPLRNQALIPLIKNTTGIEVDPEDGMPSGICNDCLQQIRKVDWIRRRTQKSNILIKKFHAMKKDPNSSSSALLANERPEFSEDLFEEDASGSFRIEDVFSLENSPDDALFANLDIKEEPDEEIDDVSMSTECERVVRSPNRPKICKKCHTTFFNAWSFKSHTKYCERKFQCLECSKCFWNSRLLYKHKQMRYSCVSDRSHRICYGCQKVFRWKWQLLFHVLLHDLQPCGLCDAMLYSVEQLKQHIKDKHS